LQFLSFFLDKSKNISSKKNDLEVNEIEINNLKEKLKGLND
jgi:hypothetical protein